MSSKDNFHAMVENAGAMVTINTPPSGIKHRVLMAGSGTTREYSISGDDSQDGEDVVMSVSDFPNFSDAPKKGDRIVDKDGSLFAVKYVRKMYGVDNGVGRVLMGWRLRIVG